MEILENVQVLDDSFLAEVSGGVEWKAAAGKEAAGKFFDTWFGWAVTGVAGVALIALSALGTKFLPKTRRGIATLAAKLPEGWPGAKWGANAVEMYKYEDSASTADGYEYVAEVGAAGTEGHVAAHIARKPAPVFEA